jgi:ribosomal protein S18 acetylase RimI-like enzyme
MQNSKNKLVLRDARLDELDSIALIIKEAYSQYQPSVTPAGWQEWLVDLQNVRGRLSESQLIVAETDGRLAGTVTLYLKAGPVSKEGWPEGWAGVRLLAVHPDFRQRGIAHALLEECIRRSRKNGNIAIGLHTSAIMADAVRIYENMGFIRVPEFDFYLGKGTLVIAYRLDLMSELKTRTHGS